MIVATQQTPVARSQLTSGMRLRPLLPFFPTMVDVGRCEITLTGPPRRMVVAEEATGD